MQEGGRKNKMVKRKPRALTKSTRQTGSSNMARDKKRKALAPGKRRSKKGNIYYENRKNRSDVKGRDTPVRRKKRKVVKRVVKRKVSKPLLPKFSHLTKAEILRKYKANEKRNAHSKNAVMLIGIFGTVAQQKKAIKIFKAHMKRGHILKAEQDYLYKYGHSHYKKLLPKKSVKKAPVGSLTALKRSKAKLYKEMGAKSISTEPLRGVRKHALLPMSVRSKIPPLYAQDGKKDPKVYLKLFSPYSNYTLYVTEFDGKDTFFGYAQTGPGSEWGYSSFKELVSANRRGLPLIERDKWFSPKKASKINAIKRLKRK